MWGLFIQVLLYVLLECNEIQLLGNTYTHYFTLYLLCVYVYIYIYILPNECILFVSNKW
jgi:hypothetical protein